MRLAIKVGVGVAVGAFLVWTAPEARVLFNYAVRALQ
jgi:hypothetical protein